MKTIFTLPFSRGSIMASNIVKSLVRLSYTRPAATAPRVVLSTMRCTLSTSIAHQTQLFTPRLAGKVLVARGVTCHYRRPEWMSSRFYSDGEALIKNRGELEENVLNVLKLFDKVDPEKLALDSHFINDLGLDSLDVVEIVMAFEDEFGLEIDDDQSEKIFTPREAVEFLQKELDIN